VLWWTWRVVIALVVVFGLREALPFALDRVTRASPRDCFEKLFHQPPPAIVSEIQGTGSAYRDFTCTLRFRVEPGNIPELVKTLRLDQWTPVSWEESRTYFSLEYTDYQKYFHPSWTPEAAPAKEVYSIGTRERWFVLIDRASGLIYVVDNAT